MSSRSWEVVAAAGYRLIDLPTFEMWLYENAALETEIGESNYLDLISFDFAQPHAKHELVSLVRRVQSRWGRSEPEDLAAYLAHAYLDGEIDLATIAGVLAGFWSEGAEWIPSEFVKINSELDAIPLPRHYALWNAYALQRKLAEVAPTLREFEEDARKAATALLSIIEVRRQNAG